MKNTERKYILRAVGSAAVLVVTTVVAAGTPIVLAHHLTSDDPAPTPIPVEFSVDGG